MRDADCRAEVWGMVDGWGRAIVQRGREDSDGAREMASGGVLVGEGVVHRPHLSVDLHPRNYHLNLSVCV